jgi:DNA adenine methylase
MATHTPLRYPGGKRRLVNTVAKILEANGLRDIHYVEPYAGGAAIPLALLYDEYASCVHINDLSRPIFAFWHSVLNHTDELCDMISSARVTIPEWRKRREIYRHQADHSLLDLGFATLFLNRTNRSGIISGGVIGGLDQKGAWKLDARFGKESLIDRVRKIGRYRDRIKLYQMDALDFTINVIPRLGDNTFTFFDPPYFDIQRPLYLNNYKLADHQNMALAVQNIRQPWIVTYDFGALRHNLYSRRRHIVFGLKYTTQKRVQAEEVMFLSDDLVLPDLANAFAKPTIMFSMKSRLSLAA